MLGCLSYWRHAEHDDSDGDDQAAERRVELIEVSAHVANRHGQCGDVLPGRSSASDPSFLA
jgi:hypothetical protein